MCFAPYLTNAARKWKANSELQKSKWLVLADSAI